MPALIRFRREDIRNLRVGDVIRYKILFQSRTAYIVGVKAQGQILALANSDAVDGQPVWVEGQLRDKNGIVQAFRLTDQDRVYRRAGSAVQPMIGAPESEPRLSEGHEARAAEG